MSSLPYRPEIDGLRAIAVLAVIGYHVGLSFLPGGFLGVDVFFVISGFVIGRLLKSEFEVGQFSFVAFFNRRIRRLGPALIVVVAASFCAALLLMKPWDMERFCKSVVAVFGIYANRYFMKSTDYFSPAADTQPLLHVWSLSIEEQFYLVLPILLFAIYKLQRSKFISPILICLTALSFSLAAFYPYKLVATPFYSFETRIWELLAGVTLAFGFQFFQHARPKTMQGVALVGLVMVLVPLFIPGIGRVPALAVVVGTVLVIAASSNGGIAQRILSLRILVGIGLISYSLYLWHQPVLAFARLAFAVPEFSNLGIFLLLCLILSLSLLSYRFVEMPFRKQHSQNAHYVVPVSLVFAVGLAALASVGAALNGFKSFYLARQAPDVAARTIVIANAIASRGTPSPGNLADCQFWSERLDESWRRRVSACQQSHGPAIVILGDSHAIDLFKAFKSNLGDSFVLGISRGACGPSRFQDDVCPYGAVENVLRDGSVSVERVFLTLSGNYFFNMQEQPNSLDVKLAKATADYVSKLAARVPVVWLGPQYEPHVSIENLNPNKDLKVQVFPSPLVTYQTRDRLLAEYAQQRNIHYISKIEGVLIDAEQDFFADTQLTYSDTDHWSDAGEKLFGARLIAKLRQVNLLP